MTDEQKHDHWSELANQVGASPPSDGGEKGEQLASTDDARSEGDSRSAEVYDRVEVEISPRKVRSYRPKTGWEELAQEFALPETSAVPTNSTAEAAEAFDALFEDATPGGGLVAELVEEEVDFEEAVAAASKEIESERIGAEKHGKRRKKRRRRPEKTDSSKADALQPAADSSDREQQAEERTHDKRRQKGRSRRKKDPRQTIAEDTLLDVEDVEDVWDEPFADDEKRRDPQKDDDKSREKEDEDHDGSEEPQERDKMISHRGIPTWDEAMEYIIAANMEKRSKKSGGGSQSRSRGGRGGGHERANFRKRSV